LQRLARSSPIEVTRRDGGRTSGELPSIPSDTTTGRPTDGDKTSPGIRCQLSNH